MTMMKMDGYDDCILGVLTQHTRPPIVVYDRDKVIQKLVDQDGMSYEDAVEFHEFNQACAWVGDGTPGFLDPYDPDVMDDDDAS